MIEKWAQLVVEEAQRNLGATRRINGKTRRVDSSGDLRNSLEFRIEETKDGPVISFLANDYGDYVEEGQKGTKSTPISAKGSSFKRKKQPPPELIKQWIKEKPIRFRKNNKFAKRTDSDLNSQAFLIGRKIKEHGIEGIHYYEEAINELADELDDFIIELIDPD